MALSLERQIAIEEEVVWQWNELPVNQRELTFHNFMKNGSEFISANIAVEVSLDKEEADFYVSSLYRLVRSEFCGRVISTFTTT
jgi:hypothetical protein